MAAWRTSMSAAALEAEYTATPSALALAVVDMALEVTTMEPPLPACLMACMACLMPKMTLFTLAAIKLSTKLSSHSWSELTPNAPALRTPRCQNASCMPLPRMPL